LLEIECGGGLILTVRVANRVELGGELLLEFAAEDAIALQSTLQSTASER